MKYTVIILPRAEFDFQRCYDFTKKRSKPGADSWANAFHRALKRLHEQPEALGLAPESEDHDEHIRQLPFKTRQGLTYRTLRHSRKSRPHHPRARAGTRHHEPRRNPDAGLTASMPPGASAPTVHDRCLYFSCRAVGSVRETGGIAHHVGWFESTFR